jgi:hypothetical protein
MKDCLEIPIVRWSAYDNCMKTYTSNADYFDNTFLERVRRQTTRKQKLDERRTFVSSEGISSGKRLFQLESPPNFFQLLILHF